MTHCLLANTSLGHTKIGRLSSLCKRAARFLTFAIKSSSLSCCTRQRAWFCDQICTLYVPFSGAFLSFSTTVPIYCSCDPRIALIMHNRLKNIRMYTVVFIILIFPFDYYYFTYFQLLCKTLSFCS